MADRTLYLVFSNPREGREQEYLDWYENVHIPDVLAIPGMLNAQRYTLREAKMTHDGRMPPQAHRYLVAYEMEGDVDEIMGKVQAAVAAGTMAMHDALAIEETRMNFWAPLGDRIDAD